MLTSCGEFFRRRNVQFIASFLLSLQNFRAEAAKFHQMTTCWIKLMMNAHEDKNILQVRKHPANKLCIIRELLVDFAVVFFYINVFPLMHIKLNLHLHNATNVVE